mmetsp:Transcript_936/g.3377  ORF Transcript_936/g.3377 Transcript_936/m.3377 type:complete len:88 (+) Transcript_936:734-997(+)
MEEEKVTEEAERAWAREASQAVVVEEMASAEAGRACASETERALEKRMAAELEAEEMKGGEAASPWVEDTAQGQLRRLLRAPRLRRP